MTAQRKLVLQDQLSVEWWMQALAPLGESWVRLANEECGRRQQAEGDCHCAAVAIDLLPPGSAHDRPAEATGAEAGDDSEVAEAVRQRGPLLLRVSDLRWNSLAPSRPDSRAARGVEGSQDMSTNPTAPVPTTAAHLAMVEALRDIGEVTRDGRCGACSWAVEVCDAGRSSQKRCRGRDARAALEGWEKRPRLRDQGELKAAVFALVSIHDAAIRAEPMFHGRQREREKTTGDILDAIEAALFGTGPRTGREGG